MRARNLKPGFFKNECLLSLSPLHRLLFAGLWCMADRNGVLEDRPAKIKIEILPMDDCDVDRMLDDLSSADGFLQRYEAEGKRYLLISNFIKHQKPHPRESALYPAPEEKQETATAGREKELPSKAFPSSSLNPSSLNPSSLNPSLLNMECLPKKKVREIARTTEKEPVVQRPRTSKLLVSTQKKKRDIPPAVEAYQDIARLYPHKSTWKGIDSTVGMDPADLAKWGETVSAWIAIGFKPTNICGMLDAFSRGELPGKGHPGGNSHAKIPKFGKKAQGWVDLIRQEMGQQGQEGGTIETTIVEESCE